jgi:uncharacterized pyridoxamine 5'-phosphate oxidase family protein
MNMNYKNVLYLVTEEVLNMFRQRKKKTDISSLKQAVDTQISLLRHAGATRLQGHQEGEK